MHKLQLSILLLAPVVVLSAYACDQGTPAEPELNAAEHQQGDFLTANTQDNSPFLGSWRATAAVVGDVELNVGTSVLYIMTFRSDGTHSVSVSNDIEHLVCPGPQTGCAWDGLYSYTGTTITTLEPNHPDPGEAGEDTFLYANCSGKLIFMDHTDEEEGIRLTFQRTGLGR
jgi:hypothetical protein